MIERILVMCATRTESLRWLEILRQQIKCARTASISGGSISTSGLPTPHHPLPPPHVSPPFILLTMWIRDAIADGRLSLMDIKELTKQYPKWDTWQRPLSPWRWRNHYEQHDEIFLTETEIEEDNPYGYIRYMSEHSSGDEIMLLLPTPIVSRDPTSAYTTSTASSSSGMLTLQNSVDDLTSFLTKKLPPQTNTFPEISHSRTQSLTELSDITDVESSRDYNPNERLQSCPPTFKSSQESLAFIDKTPSKESLAFIPYCPPIQIDYEDFQGYPDPLAVVVTDQSLIDHRSDLVILPVESLDYARPIPSPVFPLNHQPLYQSCQNLKIDRLVPDSLNSLAESLPPLIQPPLYTSAHQIEVTPRRKPAFVENVRPSTKTPNNKGHYCVEVQMQVSPPPPETPDLLRNLVSVKEKARKSIDCRPYKCYSKMISSEDEYAPIHQDKTNDLEHECPMSSLSRDDTLDEDYPYGLQNGYFWWRTDGATKMSNYDLKDDCQPAPGTLI